MGLLAIGGMAAAGFFGTDLVRKAMGKPTTTGLMIEQHKLKNTPQGAQEHLQPAQFGDKSPDTTDKLRGKVNELRGKVNELGNARPSVEMSWRKKNKND